MIFPVYAYKAHNSTRLLWWSRRYVPTVLPLVLLLIALALGVALTPVISNAGTGSWAGSGDTGSGRCEWPPRCR